MLPLWAWDHPKFCRQLPARDHHRHHNSPRSMRLVALMEISECPKKCRINGSYLLWFVLVRSISRRVGVSWFMGLGVWIWREAKMKECFDEISHRSGVINLAAYKEASWRTWWCRTKSLWNFPCTYITTYIYIHMYVFLCLHRYKHISYILYMRIYVYIYICIIETCFSFLLPGGVVWWFSQKRCVGSEGKTIQQWDIQPKVPGLSSTFESQLQKNSFTNPHSSIHYTSQSRNCNPGFVSPLTA